VPPLDRRPVDEPRTVYRFVDASDVDDPELPKDFLSDIENGIRPFFKSEKRWPERFEGMSVFGSYGAALSTWNAGRERALERGEPMKTPRYIAEVELVPGQGLDIEDLHKDDEHLTIWGDPVRLAAATCRIYDPVITKE
jgi:hypothetical protein